MSNKSVVLVVLMALCVLGTIAMSVVGITKVMDKHRSTEVSPAIQALELQEAQLNQRVNQMTSHRDSLRDEIKNLVVQKRGLEASDPVPTVITNTVTVTNIVVITTNVVNTITNVQEIAAIDLSNDGRCTGRDNIGREFNTYTIFAMPYSPHEFIFRSDGHIYWAYSSGRSTNVDLYFRILE